MRHATSIKIERTYNEDGTLWRLCIKTYDSRGWYIGYKCYTYIGNACILAWGSDIDDRQSVVCIPLDR